MSEYDVCSVCLSNITDTSDKYILEPCKHVFHNSCIINTLRKCGPKCPNCRGLDPIMKNNFCYDLDPYLNQYDSPNYESDDDALIRVSRWGQPFETVLRRSDLSGNYISDNESDISSSNDNNFILDDEVIDISKEVIDISEEVIDISEQVIDITNI